MVVKTPDVVSSQPGRDIKQTTAAAVQEVKETFGIKQVGGIGRAQITADALNLKVQLILGWNLDCQDALRNLSPAINIDLCN